MVLWIQLPELPLELYHPKALYKIGQLLGKPVKMDVNTAFGYARICVEIDTSQPLFPQVPVGSVTSYSL